MPETCVPFADIDGTSKGTWIETFNDRQLKGCQMVGIDSKGHFNCAAIVVDRCISHPLTLDLTNLGTAGKDYKGWMIDQGFENVTEVKYQWPIGTWAKGKKVRYLSTLATRERMCGNRLIG